MYKYTLVCRAHAGDLLQHLDHATLQNHGASAHCTSDVGALRHVCEDARLQTAHEYHTGMRSLITSRFMFW